MPRELLVEGLLDFAEQRVVSFEERELAILEVFLIVTWLHCRHREQSKATALVAGLHAQRAGATVQARPCAKKTQAQALARTLTLARPPKEATRVRP
mmetsp:Transcript_90482/g.170560  ORF Transcript_90482/g.170560 Transcript_90482/m.170560 type:complete len:97 (-) Transcript_90482:2-292(-)